MVGQIGVEFCSLRSLWDDMVVKREYFYEYSFSAWDRGQVLKNQCVKQNAPENDFSRPDPARWFAC
jgi:hypothetical protein